MLGGCDYLFYLGLAIVIDRYVFMYVCVCVSGDSIVFDLRPHMFERTHFEVADSSSFILGGYPFANPTLSYLGVEIPCLALCPLLCVSSKTIYACGSEAPTCFARHSLVFVSSKTSFFFCGFEAPTYFVRYSLEYGDKATSSHVCVHYI